ncbi:MAG TPA: hypothetical protein EYQ82_05910 [Dehalococcoidia bacterium]|nr:hypothetical protein [Dehalococcoidia bacterium]
MEALPPQAAAEEFMQRANKSGGTHNGTMVVAAVLPTDPVSANGTPGANTTLLDDCRFGRNFASAARRRSPSG